MNINSVRFAGGGMYAASAGKAAGADSGERTAQAESAQAQESVRRPDVDTYIPSAPAEEEKAPETTEETKRTGALTREQVSALKDQMYESMKALAEKLLGIQIRGSEGFSELAESLGVGTTPEEAAKAISEDGMWGVDAVATRLMDMAQLLSGGDSSKAELLREAVQKGFEQVGDLEDLPQVCQDTYKEVMDRFDYWEANGTMDGYGQTVAEATGAAQ